MIAIVSPAKTLDFESASLHHRHSIPVDLEESKKLIKKLRTFSRKQLGNLMSISPQLADLNFNRYQNWSETINPSNGKIAIEAFKGEVYRGLNVTQFSPDDFEFAQERLFILSGLHGLLKPLDLIEPYRLEMGTKLTVGRKKNLYEFWSKRITQRLNESLAKFQNAALINLASIEYFKAVDSSKLEFPIINCHFKEYKNGDYKIVMTYAKLARGAMAAFMIQNRLQTPESLKGFNWDGYSYNSHLSNENDWVFTRKQTK